MGLVGTAIIIAALVAVFNYDSIPGLSGTQTVVAEFDDASGLTAGDSVQISGIEVGKISSISLSGDHVDIDLEIDTDGRSLGKRTTASIKVETALGRRYVEVRPDGDGDIGDRISLENTSSGFDITESLNQLTHRLEGTDKKQLSEALDSVSTVLDEIPDNLRPSLEGLSRLSTTIASRDEELRNLLQQSNSVTGILAERNQNLVALVSDGGILFSALNDRAATIRALLVRVRAVSDELRGLAQDNAATTGPMLAQVDRVLETLNANYANINDSISGLRPYVTQLGEVVGSGPFFSVLLQNITPANLNGQQPGSPGGDSHR